MRINLKFTDGDKEYTGSFGIIQGAGGKQNLLVVTVDGSYKASHTAGEIYDFVQGGGSAVLVLPPSNVFNPQMIGTKTCRFNAIFNSTMGATEWILDVDASGKATFSSVVCSALKNPNPITFKGAVNATYDGSKAVSVEIPTGASDAENLALLVETDMLPAVYNADGKILTDENGKIILRY